MKITVEKLKKSEVKLIIEISDAEMGHYRDKACEKISQEVKIKGFRPGHAPLHILEQHVGEQVIKAQTAEIAVPITYIEAVKQEKLEIVAHPKINILSEKPFKYEATVAVMPEVKVKDYDKIKVKKLDDKPDKKEIDEAVGYLEKSAAQYKEITRALQKGDKAEIDFEGFDMTGVPLENTKSKNHPVIIGEKSLIRDFENELIGLKKGDKKEFELTFPKPYHAKSLEGKKVKFKVEVKGTFEVIVPELDEKLVEEITGKKMSVKDFRADLEKNIEARKKEENRIKQENEFLEKIIEKTEVEIPQALIDEEVDYMIEDMKSDMERKGVKFDDFLEKTKTEINKLREKYSKEAEKRVKIRMALNFIFRAERIEIADHDVENEIEKALAYYTEEEKKKLREMYKNDKSMRVRTRNRILLQKMFDKFMKLD